MALQFNKGFAVSGIDTALGVVWLLDCPAINRTSIINIIFVLFIDSTLLACYVKSVGVRSQHSTNAPPFFDGIDAMPVPVGANDVPALMAAIGHMIPTARKR